jgi:hypothetical protein
MNLKNRMAGIDANLDDVQSGMEACSRATDALQTDTAKFDGHLGAPLTRSVMRHMKELQSCVRDQRMAMQELREGITRLQHELKRSNGAVRQPPLPATAREPGQTAGRSWRVRSR